MAQRKNGVRGVDAISVAFRDAEREGRAALITYLTAGYPSSEASAALVKALIAGGSDIIELGVPFSDPVADGPAIQKAAQVALAEGMTMRRCLEMVSGLRERGVTAPILLMGYYNPIHSYGVERYAADCRAAGVHGLIVPDLPPEEAGPLGDACREAGLALVFLVAPTTPEQRLAMIAEETTGFLYVVSRLGTTGVADAPGADLVTRLEAVRRQARTPVAVGFGISTSEQAKAVSPLVDGVVVGSAIVERADQGPEAVREYVSTLARVLGESRG